MMNMKNTINRREFLGAGSALAAGAVWSNLASRAPAFESPNDRPRLGVIGCGSRWGFQIASGRSRYGAGPSFVPYGDMVAVCDVDQERMALGREVVEKWYDKKPDTAADYRAILDRDDIDVVTIFTPDHWHAKVAIEAMLAGKDVYCEKPMTLTIEEGRQICEVTEKTGRIFQVGTQQRSGHQFIKAIAMLRDGRLGKIKRVECGVGGAPGSPEIPAATPPSSLDWNRWLGPAPKVPFRYLEGAKNETDSWSNCHYEFRWWYEYSGGKLTDWGAHHVDIATWGLDKTETGPVSVTPEMVEHPVEFENGYPVKDDRYNTATAFVIKARYADDIELELKSHARNGILFEGTEGRMFVNRGSVQGKPVEQLNDDPLPEDLMQKVYKGFSMENIERMNDTDAHMRSFFQAVASRKEPISDVFSHHRALTTCHLAGIAARLGRKIEWNPQTERMVDDPLAQSFVAREKRKGFEIEM
jgi:predicted dehydrogenase